MGYRNEVAFAIGGKLKNIRQLLHDFKAAKYPVSNDFLAALQVIQIKKDLTILVYYHDWTRWDLEDEQYWQTVRDLAEKAKLSYIYRRIGEDLDDVEMDANDREDYFDDRLESLIVTVRSIQLDSAIKKHFGVVPGFSLNVIDKKEK